MRHYFGCCDSDFIPNAVDLRRWCWQMVAGYEKLPEHSKESDRKEARKTLYLVTNYIMFE